MATFMPSDPLGVRKTGSSANNQAALANGSNAVFQIQLDGGGARDFGLTFNTLLDGRWAVGDHVAINIELELVEQTQEQEAAATSG